MTGGQNASAARMKSKPRVLLLSASSGAGHVRAAQALEKAFATRGDCSVEHIDAIEYVSKLFQRVYDKAYISMVRRAPEFMGVLYERTDQPWHHPRRRLAMDRLNTAPMIRLLKRVQPDLCVATHFLPAEIIAWLIAKRKLRAHNAVVVTDYDVHAMWLCRTVDRYYVAIDEAAEYLARIGVPREELRVTGIPIDPVFAKPVDRGEARRLLRLDVSAPLILVAAGGYGIGPVEQLVNDLLALQSPWQIVAIAGKAEKVRKRLDEISRDAGELPSGAASALSRRIHHRYGQIHGCGRFARRQGGRSDHFGSSGAALTNGSDRTDPGAGRAQRGSFARSRSCDSMQQFARGRMENSRIAGRHNAPRKNAGRRQGHGQAWRGRRYRRRRSETGRLT